MELLLNAGDRQNVFPEFMKARRRRRYTLDRSTFFQHVPDPFIHLGIDDQVNAVFGAPVPDAMRAAGVDVIAASLFEAQALSFEIELHARIGPDRYMKAHLAFRITEVRIGVLPNQ